MTFINLNSADTDTDSVAEIGMRTLLIYSEDLLEQLKPINIVHLFNWVT